METEKKRRGMNVYWTPERITEVAKTCTSKTELQKKAPACYQRAVKTGQINTFEWFKSYGHKRKPRGYYTPERCRKEAMKYTRLKDFRRHSYSCYMICMMRRWLDEYDWLEKDLTHRPKPGNVTQKDVNK